MARAITPGPGEKEKRTECESCGALVGYVKNDIHAYHGTDMSGGPDGQEWINCPQCKKKIILRSW